MRCRADRSLAIWPWRWLSEPLRMLLLRLELAEAAPRSWSAAPSLFLIRAAVSTRRELSRSRSAASSATSLCSVLRALLDVLELVALALELLLGVVGAWRERSLARRRAGRRLGSASAEQGNAGERAGALRNSLADCCSVVPAFNGALSPCGASRLTHQRLRITAIMARQALANALRRRWSTRDAARASPGCRRRYGLPAAAPKALRNCRERRSNVDGDRALPPDHAGRRWPWSWSLLLGLWNLIARQEPQPQPEADALARRAAVRWPSSSSCSSCSSTTIAEAAAGGARGRLALCCSRAFRDRRAWSY